MERIVKPFASRWSVPYLAALLLFLPWLCGCYTTDDARMLQVLNERGFGRKYTGNANEVFYFGVGDLIKFQDKDNPELSGTARVRMDGTVDFPMLGETYVAGLTSREIAAMLNMRLGQYYKYVNIAVSPAQVVSKRIFIQVDTNVHIVKQFKGDMTLFDVLQSVHYDSMLVDLDNVKVIRADPVHPLVMYCDMDAMISDGNSRDNILVKEDDIIYLTPTFIGYVVRVVRWFIEPLRPIAELWGTARSVYYSWSSPYYGYGYGRRRYGGSWRGY